MPLVLITNMIHGVSELTNLATIEVIKDVRPHSNADRLDIVQVLGYEAIVGRDQYKVGDSIIFIQPDSILPSDQEWCQDLLSYTSRGRIRAIRLRGEWSMGLVVSTDKALAYTEFNEGDDVTETLGVTKHEPALPTNLHARGGLPFGIPRTDEERYQNIRNLDELIGTNVDISLKVDGSSATYYCLVGGHLPGEDQTKVGLCSRSLELKMGEDDNGNAYNSRWHLPEKRYDILNKLRTYCEEHNISLALRGEVFGPGVQSMEKNPHSKVEEMNFTAFSVWYITEGHYASPYDTHYYTNVAKALGIPVVPMLEEDVVLTQEKIDYYDNGAKKLNNTPFEGVVITMRDAVGHNLPTSFKVINKWYDSEK